MLDSNPDSLDTASWALQFFVFFVGLVIYGHLKRNLATVVAVEHQANQSEKDPAEAAPEKRALLGLADAGAVPLQESVQNRLPTSLIVWAVFILAVNAAAWYMTSIAWITALIGKTDLWQLIFLSVFTFGPVAAALNVFICGCFLSMKSARTEPREAERYRVLLRGGMLDGVVLAPAGAVYVVYLYPEHILGQCCALAGLAAYVLQALVWASFFQASRRESQAKRGSCQCVTNSMLTT